MNKAHTRARQALPLRMEKEMSVFFRQCCSDELFGGKKK